MHNNLNSNFESLSRRLVYLTLRLREPQSAFGHKNRRMSLSPNTETEASE